jgi:hypothetical protein
MCKQLTAKGYRSASSAGAHTCKCESYLALAITATDGLYVLVATRKDARKEHLADKPMCKLEAADAGLKRFVCDVKGAIAHAMVELSGQHKSYCKSLHPAVLKAPLGAKQSKIITGEASNTHSAWMLCTTLCCCQCCCQLHCCSQQLERIPNSRTAVQCSARKNTVHCTPSSTPSAVCYMMTQM